MHERVFVLAPLAEMAPDLRHPMHGRTMLELLRALSREPDTGPALLDEHEQITVLSSANVGYGTNHFVM